MFDHDQVAASANSRATNGPAAGRGAAPGLRLVGPSRDAQEPAGQAPGPSEYSPLILVAMIGFVAGCFFTVAAAALWAALS